jgi:hypothetical protein
VIELINPILRGWVNSFAVGHSGRCFAFIEDWVEKKIRRHMMRAKKRKGFGWKRWSREWLYQVLGLFSDYRLRYYESTPKIAPAIGLITLDAKQTGKPSDRNGHARFDAAGSGNRFTVRLVSPLPEETGSPR